MNLNPREHKQIHTHRGTTGVGGGGWMEPLPRVFDVLQHIETILLLVESLCHDLRIFYGWWRCWRPVTSPTMVAILNWKSG